MENVTEDARLSVAVVIASLGRPELLSQMCRLMDGQSRQPDMLLFSVVSDSDIPDDLVETDTRKVIRGRKGLTAQRNNAINWLGDDYDIILFYDDDFVPSCKSVDAVERFFRTHSDVVGASGWVIADGINGAGYSLEQALEKLEKHDKRNFSPNCIVATLHGLYGCNMAYRTAAIGQTRFDERLRLYAWQEDIDFAGALKDKGRLVRTFAFAGVHQGVKFGRTPGLRLGYSQVINPAYLARKGTMRPGFALKLIARNFFANHLKSLNPEPWADRWGRAKGNWLGLGDLVRGRLTPERIEDL